MTVLTQVTRAMQRVLSSDAERVARRTGVIQRQRKLTASALAQGLVLGWLKNPDATLEQLAQAVGIAGVEMTATALSNGRPLQGETTLDQSVLLGAEALVPARLIVRRVSPAEAKRRRKQARKAALKHGRKISPERLAWCALDVLATNLPPERLTVDEAWVLAGARWQIEMLFKLWKSYGHLAQSRSENPWRVLTEIYAKLLGLLLAHWLLLTSHWHKPHRSWFKALRVVQDHALFIAWTLHSSTQLNRLCRQIQHCFALNCYTNIRNKSPTTYQLLENPKLIAP